MIRSYRYRIYPNRVQQEKLTRFFGCTRKVYNLLLDWWTNAYQESKATGLPMPKYPDYNYFANTEEYSYLKECDSCALQQARIHFYNALKSYLDAKSGNRKGRVGFPKHKKRGKSPDSYTTYNNNGTTVKIIDNRYITLPKLGKVRIILHRPFDGRIKSVNISRTRSGKYYVSLTVDTDTRLEVVNKLHNIDGLSVVGLDMSLSRFVVSSDQSDDTIPKYVRNYRREETRLKRLEKNLHRKTKGSRNRDKARKRLAVASEKVAERRRDYVVKTVLHFVRKYDVIVLEDINLQGMSKSLHLGKSVMDLGFGEFRRWLEWECQKYDTFVWYADRFFPSSKACNRCGCINRGLKLSDRVWTCPECGAVLDRDVNAAENLRDVFIASLYMDNNNRAGTARMQACGDVASTLRETLGRAVSVKQEAHKSLAYG